tara:strand:- start:1387 stop:2151 length:765 start_codon:yes stop_codon:yes gene_type:complete
MRCGQVIDVLTEQQASWLQPIHKVGPQKSKALLMLHGFSSSPAVFRLLMPKIVKSYDSIIVPALPGHATSIKDFATAKASEWIKTCEDVCSDLVGQYGKVDVLGLSLGGLLATHLSNRFDLNHLYLLAPALRIKSNIMWAIKTAQFFKTLGFTQIRNRAGNLKSDESTEIAYRKLPLNSILEILTLIKDFKFEPPQCPTDVFLGRFDDVVSSDAVEALFKSQETAHIHRLNDSAHVLPLDNDVDLIARCINQTA